MSPSAVYFRYGNVYTRYTVHRQGPVYRVASYKERRDGQTTYDVTLRRVRVSIIAV
jgi:hypothetical protein